jgi:hypothetical protein
MQSVLSSARRQAALFALVLLAALRPLPGAAQSLFATHEVTVDFATPDGKPFADATVRVFAPGRPDKPALTGHTDKKGHFEFPADRDGFWTAEARHGGEIARVMIRVGSSAAEKEKLSPYWLIGGLLLLLILAFAYRIARIRGRRQPPPPTCLPPP